MSGSATPIAEGLRARSLGWDFFAVSQTGSLVYLTGGAEGGLLQLVEVDLDGNAQALDLAPRDIATVGWSPNGRSIVYSGERHIFTYNVELGTTPRQLTFDGRNIDPAFSPDGTRVVFSSERAGTDGLDLFVKDLNDDAAPRSIGQPDRVRAEGWQRFKYRPLDTRSLRPR